MLHYYDVEVKVSDEESNKIIEEVTDKVLFVSLPITRCSESFHFTKMTFKEMMAVLKYCVEREIEVGEINTHTINPGVIAS